MGVVYSLLFNGCIGYHNSFSGHRKGEKKDYSKEEAEQLLRDMPDGFTLIEVKDGNYGKTKVEEKQMPKVENKMIDIIPENKEESSSNLPLEELQKENRRGRPKSSAMLRREK